MLTVEVAAKTPFGNEILQRGIQQGIEKGIEKGIAEGLAKGAVEGEREAIRLFLESRFPSLAATRLDHISTRDQARSIQKKLYSADTEDQAQSALRGE